ncbi:MAG: hypothetical protein MI799_06940, partial [Desulfobacterales bacterium]|nr:hypothetical protein [Desulfobacterales bacterium]
MLSKLRATVLIFIPQFRGAAVAPYRPTALCLRTDTKRLFSCCAVDYYHNATADNETNKKYPNNNLRDV